MAGFGLKKGQKRVFLVANWLTDNGDKIFSFLCLQPPSAGILIF
jgi:hypothetical protein